MSIPAIIIMNIGAAVLLVTILTALMLTPDSAAPSAGGSPLVPPRGRAAREAASPGEAAPPQARRSRADLAAGRGSVKPESRRVFRLTMA